MPRNGDETYADNDHVDENSTRGQSTCDRNGLLLLFSLEKNAQSQDKKTYEIGLGLDSRILKIIPNHEEIDSGSNKPNYQTVSKTVNIKERVKRLKKKL